MPFKIGKLRQRTAFCARSDSGLQSPFGIYGTEELAQFIDAASERYQFSKTKLIALGYSTGANIAASLILLHPHYLAAAVLFRAMVGAGRLDPIVQSEPGCEEERDPEIDRWLMLADMLLGKPWDRKPS